MKKRIASIALAVVAVGAYAQGMFTWIDKVSDDKDKILPGVEEPFFGTWLFGISAQGIGTVGMLLNFAVTLVVSRLTPPPPPEVQALVQNVRTPDHPGRAIILDEATE